MEEKKEKDIEITIEKEVVESSPPELKKEKTKLLHPRAIANFTERIFREMINSLQEKDEEKDNLQEIFCPMTILDELIDFGFPKDICEKYFKDNQV